MFILLCISFEMNLLNNLQTHVVSPHRPLSSTPPERYLAYLPHSGLSNQRIELANALMLAALLKRTLIVPPAFLGNVVGWMPKDMLLDHLGWLTDASVDFQTLCRPPTPGDLASYVHRHRCSEYRQFGVIDWRDLHPIDTDLPPSVRIHFQTRVSLTQLQHDLGISENDTYVYEDEQLYDWRLYEDPEEARDLVRRGANFVDSFAGRRYYKVFTIDHWRRRPERLLQLGGVFGSTRINLVDPAHLELKKQIAYALRYRRDTALGDSVLNVVRYLGGMGRYLAVHFRTGDSPFRQHLEQNMYDFARAMGNFTGAEMPDPPIPDDDDDLPEHGVQLIPPLDGLDKAPWSTVCRPYSPPYKDGFRTTIYIATDHRRPRADDSQLRPWFDWFPCTVVFNDLPEYLFTPLQRIQDLIDPSKSLGSFLIPLVDAMVAAHAKEILTTPRSTFSKYIGELHDMWVA